jgi:hypothetical protein
MDEAAFCLGLGAGLLLAVGGRFVERFLERLGQFFFRFTLIRAAARNLLALAEFVRALGGERHPREQRHRAQDHHRNQQRGYTGNSVHHTPSLM